MNFFQKKSTKKLNIKEMWELYKLLKDALPKQDEEYLIHEVSKILENISTESFQKSLMLLNKKKSIPENPIKAVLLFIDGLRTNEFFSFVKMIKEF